MSRPRARHWPLAALVVTATASTLPACKKTQNESVLQSQDTLVADGTMFDPTEVIPSAAFVDSSSFVEGDLAQFLHGTPYGTASFLDTYQSDGTSAVDAVLTAAQTYKINPLVFLVAAEVSQGLIAASTYPTDAARVEFVFGCGCFGPGDCDPAFAGFDKQVSCLGQQLRSSLDAIGANGKTASGWGPMTPKTTADGVSVSPQDDSTAALYNYDPYVGNGSSGNSLFWNVWNLYATAIGYNNTQGAPESGWVGDACFTDEGCSFASAICARGGYPGGMCTKQCASDSDCPNDRTHTTTFCAKFADKTDYCVVSCVTGGASSCRDGYDCRGVVPVGGGGSMDACIPSP